MTGHRGWLPLPPPNHSKYQASQQQRSSRAECCTGAKGFKLFGTQAALTVDSRGCQDVVNRAGQAWQLGMMLMQAGVSAPCWFPVSPHWTLAAMVQQHPPSCTYARYQYVLLHST
jgi:hypothetical protein